MNNGGYRQHRNCRYFNDFANSVESHGPRSLCYPAEPGLSMAQPRRKEARKERQRVGMIPTIPAQPCPDSWRGARRGGTARIRGRVPLRSFAGQAPLHAAGPRVRAPPYEQAPATPAGPGAPVPVGGGTLEPPAAPRAARPVAQSAPEPSLTRCRAVRLRARRKTTRSTA